MRLVRIAWATAVALAACGGGGGGEVDYFAETVADTGAMLGERGCADIFECGALIINCPDTTCTAEYYPATNFYADEAACQTEVGQAATRRFIGCAAAHLTDAEKDLVNACYNAELHCYTAEELAAIAAAATAEQPYGPVECQMAAPVLALCDLCADTPTDPTCL